MFDDPSRPILMDSDIWPPKPHRKGPSSAPRDVDARIRPRKTSFNNFKVAYTPKAAPFLKGPSLTSSYLECCSDSIHATSTLRVAVRLFIFLRKATWERIASYFARTRNEQKSPHNDSDMTTARIAPTTRWAY
jgi:hypothetical protein